MNFLDYKISNPFRSGKPAGFYDPIKKHTGIDIICPEGTDLWLPFPTVYFSFLKQKEMGNTLYLKDYYGNILVFAHLSKTLIPDNGRISRNQIFAKSGNSGTATTAPHVHMEIIAKVPQKGLEFMTRKLGYVEGYNINPSSYLEKMKARHRKVDSWRTWSGAKRIARATINRVRKFFK